MANRRMFSPPQFATRGIVNEIDPKLQWTMWNMIDDLYSQGHQVDYLQVFTLQSVNHPSGEINQRITHHQESPPYQATKSVRVHDSVSAKVFVIDDGEHATMMLAEEY